MGLLSRIFSRGDEPMVDEQMGQFSDLRVPVSHTSGPALWSMSPADRDYLTPQTQEEHNRLLNTFYEDRKSMPNWKELGRTVEQRDPRFSDRDSTTRKNLGAKSSVIRDMAFDKEHNLAMLKMGDKWYTYAATPEQFQRFLMSGSLGREMNNIKRGGINSLMKTDARRTPKFKSSSQAGSSSTLSRIGKLFGF